MTEARRIRKNRTRAAIEGRMTGQVHNYLGLLVRLRDFRGHEKTQKTTDQLLAVI